MTRFFLLTFLLVFSSVFLHGQTRKEIEIPDIPGYQTLKCDFHMHTVFSDGYVWPTTRVGEAWRQGLDAIAITDHIEYRPHSQDIKADHNRSYELAKPAADRAGIILIRGTEITRKMPPGHLNAIFIQDANLIERDDWFEACRQAKEQGAFVFWNHPGWKTQQPDKTLWWDEHTRLHDSGILQGIEVFNSEEYYPEAFQWANEKGLTMLANSDIHSPIDESYDPVLQHRPVTLVFATERNEVSIKEALQNGRTAVYFDDTLIGDQKFLEPLFFSSLEVFKRNNQSGNKKSRSIQIHNHSEIDYQLVSTNSGSVFKYTRQITLKAHRTTLVEVNGIPDELQNETKLKLEYKVKNLLIKPDKMLVVTLEVNID